VPFVDVLIVIAATLVIVGLVLVIRTSRRDEKGMWKTPSDDHGEDD
jgi:hypothetical protein